MKQKRRKKKIKYQLLIQAWYKFHFYIGWKLKEVLKILFFSRLLTKHCYDLLFWHVTFVLILYPAAYSLYTNFVSTFMLYVSSLVRSLCFLLSNDVKIKFIPCLYQKLIFLSSFLFTLASFFKDKKYCKISRFWISFQRYQIYYDWKIPWEVIDKRKKTAHLSSIDFSPLSPFVLSFYRRETSFINNLCKNNFE